MLVMQGISSFELCDGCVIQRTPSEPDYWSGNSVFVQSDAIDASQATDIFSVAFPSARHVRIAWDLPSPTVAKVAEILEPTGFAVVTHDVMILQGEIAKTTAPENFTLRALTNDADWQASLDLQLEVGIEEGFDPATHAPYLARRNASRRHQIDEGRGQWFGAFEGGDLSAQLGIFHNATLARYQSVETRKSHRRLGFGAALLRHACHWALGRSPSADVMIIVESDSDARRLYGRLGFVTVEKLTEATKPGY